MAHRVGALTLPAPVPADGEPVADPALAIITDYVVAVLRAWIGDAWANVAPSEDLVRSVYNHDPEEVDFKEGDLPLLCIWRDADQAPKQLADSRLETENIIQILWVLPPATQFKSRARFPFFSAFDKAIALAVNNERDPAYVHEDDLDAVTGEPTPEAATWGSDVQKHAGIDWWRLQRVTRIPVEIPSGDRVYRYPAYLATLVIAETSQLDVAGTNPAGFNTSPTVIHGDITDESGDDALVRQSFREPSDA